VAKRLGQFGIIAVVALAIVALPGGHSARDVVLTCLSVAFFAAIAVMGVRLYREHRFELETLEDRSRLVLYASVGLAFLTFTATNRLFDAGGAGVIVWFALLALASYGVFWVWTRYRSYE
jgi:drug/metabolite transporter (DMT)-like permease